MRSWIRRPLGAVVVAAAVAVTAAGGIIAAAPRGPSPSPTATATATPTATATTVPCDRSATTATFAAQVAAAAPGQGVCLASGNYGTFTGTGKAITIRAADGASPQMSFDFASGDAGFTLDGMTNMDGDITTGASNITIRNSSFTGPLVITGLTNANILLDHNDHTRQAPISGTPALIHLAYCCPDDPSGVTVRNSVFHDTDADGIQAGAGVNIINNEFVRILENGPNHTDSIQLIYAIGSVVRGNWIHDVADGVVAFDGVISATIEDNVIDPVNGRFGIELYSDTNSIVRHNTIVPRSSCTSRGCGLISISHKTGQPPTAGTQIYNNLTTGVIKDAGDTLARDDHNPTSTGALFTGGASPTTFGGYCLSPLSPTGRGAADSGLDAGIRC